MRSPAKATIELFQASTLQDALRFLEYSAAVVLLLVISRVVAVRGSELRLAFGNGVVRPGAVDLAPVPLLDGCRGSQEVRVLPIFFFLFVLFVSSLLGGW